MVDGLERRGFATTSPDQSDARQINIRLTDQGARYASAVVGLIERLNQEICARVDPAALAGADTVLRAVLADRHSQRLAALLPPPAVLNREASRTPE